MIAERIQRIALSPTLRINATALAMKAEGIDVVDLSVGEPDFPTPENIKEAAKRAIDKNITKYTPNDGIPALKEAIRKKLRNENGLEYGPKEIIVSCGAKQCLYNLSVALYNKGEEAIIPAPYWVSYPQQVTLAKANPVIVPTKEENGFRITPEELKAAITFNTKALILNNPCNPTGTAYTREELEPLIDIAVDEGIYIIADEIYEKLVYDDFRFTSAASLGPQIKERAIVINGVSKAYSMTGWRIGYAAGPKEIIAAMDKVQSHNTSNAPSISQMASLEALTGPQTDIPKMVAEFQRRRNYVLHRLQSLRDVSCMVPRGAFYVFPNFSAYFDKEFKGMEIRNSYGLAYYLLKNALVAIVPGDAFGAEGFIRISYATSMENLERGMDRIIEAVSKLEKTRRVRKVALSNVMTKERSLAPTETDVSMEMRNALVGEVEAHLRYDNYYEWNANIAGVVTQLRTNDHHLYDFWMENWYPAPLEADLEPHGIIYAVDGIPGREPRAFYNSESKSGIIINTTYYAQLRAWAIGIVTDITERLFDVHSVHGACLDFDGTGLLIISPPGTGRSTHLYGLLSRPHARLLSDDWVTIRYRGQEAIADIPERKFYVETDIARKHRELIDLFDRSRCENVITRKDDCTDEACLREDVCRLDRGDPHCYWASGTSRAMLDPYWIGGPEKHVKRTTTRWVLVLKRDTSSPPLAELSPENAVEALVEGKYPVGARVSSTPSSGFGPAGRTALVGVSAGGGGGLWSATKEPFYNPYLLVRTDERLELQRRFFQRLAAAASWYHVNTGVEAPEEIQRRIIEMIGSE
ncbi:aminotransferase class I and II [candidate division TA06 bacterium SM23_40]|uniref:Aminotransferase class I and II n=2 Tax=Bacteria division TA06 TaxID=1156500 RepID=A0A0S8GCL1_UNCT6|nr:MAG: aminotransferase class I and II [candidate division TA06 bacterium SM23_40]